MLSICNLHLRFPLATVPLSLQWDSRQWDSRRVCVFVQLLSVY